MAMKRPRKIPTPGGRAGDTVNGRRFWVDMASCDGYGVCAELVPELIYLDQWGYPVVTDRPIPPELARHAGRAVAFCPRLALSMVPANEPY
jgi:ferredoxin